MFSRINKNKNDDMFSNSYNLHQTFLFISCILSLCFAF